MSKKTDPRRLLVLLAGLAIAVVFAVVRLRPSLLGVGSGGGAKPAVMGSYKVPMLGWDPNTARVLPTPRVGRSPFAYGPPPTPTPDRRPTPTPLPVAPPPPPQPTPTPDGIYRPDGSYFPPPPRFPLNFIGWLGPNRLPVAVFLDGEEVLAVAVGEKVKGNFILRQVGPTSVTFGYVGYPEDVTGTVSLVR